MTIGVRLLSTIRTYCVKYVSLFIAFESVVLVCVWGVSVSVQWKITECICTVILAALNIYFVFVIFFNPLAYTDVPETAGLARSINP